MNSERLAAIERLRELEKKATPGELFEYLILESCKQVDADYIFAFRREALPLIVALQLENKQLSESQDLLWKMSQRAIEAETEIERLRAGIAKAVKHLQRNMSDDRLYALIELEALNDA